MKIKKKICFEIDGVICKIRKDNNYKKSQPIKKNIRFINNLKDKGFKIILFTSRFMGRTNENQRKAKSLGYKLTKDQLKRWGLSYDKLIMGKPSYDLIVDDKSLFFNKNWIDTLKIKINYNKY